MAAREDFVARLANWERTLLMPELVSLAPQASEHNERAQLLRNGLAVGLFTMLEDFIRRRTGETLSRIDGNAINFDDLPEKLRRASTVGAAGALVFQARLQERSGQDSVAYVQQHADDLSSTAAAAYRLSSISFAHSSSNVNHADLSNCLQAVGVTGGWNAMSAVATRVGVGIPALEQAFKNLVLRRHRAAHDATTQVTLADLQNLPIEVRGVAISFDALLSLSCARLATGDRSVAVAPTEAAQVAIRFVREGADGWYRESPESSTRAFRRGRLRLTVWQNAMARAIAKKELLVFQAVNGVPTSWTCGYL